jgi:hypothetical protein
MSDWRDTVEGPAAVAERDQFEADLFDIIRESKLLFVIAAPLRDDGSPEVSVRALYALSDEIDSVWRREATRAFLLVARDELDRALGELEEGL